jgi:putative transposase
MIRKMPLTNGKVYHIFTRSIADFKIFNDASEFDRMIQLIRYFQINNKKQKFSDFIDSKFIHDLGFEQALQSISKDTDYFTQIIAYCLMPTHIHLILKQLKDAGISVYMSNLLNGYTRYFNTKHKRKGPLWESKFKNVLVNNDEQLLHLTRYVHLNPVTARIVEKPEYWTFSSYQEYLSKGSVNICEFNDCLEIIPKTYRKFVNQQIDYQRELTLMKNLMLD